MPQESLVNPDQAEMTQQSQSQYTISGAVNFTTAPDLMQRASSFFRDKALQAQASVKIDLSKVANCNSAGLALMFEMTKSAQEKNIELCFENLPGTLLTIAKAYGVEAEVKNISE